MEIEAFSVNRKSGSTTRLLVEGLLLNRFFRRHEQQIRRPLECHSLPGWLLGLVGFATSSTQHHCRNGDNSSHVRPAAPPSRDSCAG